MDAQSKQGPVVLELSQVTLDFRSQRGDVAALAMVDLRLVPGEFVCLLGPSGCGKTSLLKIVAGLLPASSGTVRWPGDRRPGLAYVFQEPRLLPWLTALENVAFPLMYGARVLDDRRGAARGLKAAERSRCRKIAGDWLERVGLGDFLHRYPRELSGGMNQRVAIARAFATDPDVLLMDEPFSGLDELTARQLRADLARTCLDSHVACLFVTHNPSEAAYLADRVVILSPRPARVIAEVPLFLERPRESDDPAIASMAAKIVAQLQR